MILGSLESILNPASFDIKIIQIACWEHIKPENTNTLQWHTLIINTFRGPVFTMRSLHSTQLAPCMAEVSVNRL